jgi:hypothetical protein
MTELPPITPETIWAILNDEIDDATANELVWQVLGYRRAEGSSALAGRWDLEGVAEAWREAYPEPPDFIESRPATVKLTRSIPPSDKQLLKEQLQFQGYKIGELVPRKTRRATIANYLLSYLNQSVNQSGNQSVDPLSD